MLLKAIRAKFRNKHETTLGFVPRPYELMEGQLEKTEQIYAMVDEFHQRFMQPRQEEPTPELIRLRAALIHEEAVTEGLPAAKEGNLEALIDAMADFLYVAVGTMVAVKGGIATAVTKYLPDQSVDHFWASLSPKNTVFQDMASPFNDGREIAESLEEYADWLERKKPSPVDVLNRLHAVMNKIYVACMMTYRLADFLKIDIPELMSEVHRSNMSKLWAADEHEREKQVQESQYDRSDLGFRRSEGTDMMVGYRLSDGKVLKSPAYTPVDLSSFVKQAEKSAMYSEVLRQKNL